MGFLGRLLGMEDETDRRSARLDSARRPELELDNEARAIERYRYMLRTAPPETLEQAHAEAFAKLTPEQRRQVLNDLASTAPAAERAAIAATSTDDPKALARVATRAEVREPGVLERTLGGGAMGVGASLLSSFAMGFLGSMVAQSFFSAIDGFGQEPGGAADRGDEDSGALAEHEAGAEDDASVDEELGGDDFDA